MNQNIIPLQLTEINDNIYAGFWRRLGAFLVDMAILIPYSFGLLYLTGLGKNIYLLSIIPSFIFIIFYNVYLVKKYGGTPGKLIVGIKVINKNGSDINYSNAILRFLLSFVFAIFGAVVMIFSLSKISNEEYISLGLLDRTKLISELNTSLFNIHQWVANIWVWSEFIILLTNSRKRAIHDFMASTVVIKSKYHDKIKETLKPVNNYEVISNYSLVGIFIFIVFFSSFFSFFVTNVNVLPELDFLGPTGFNLNGLPEQFQVNLLNYGLVGVLISLFGFLIGKKFKSNDPSKFGSYVLVLTGIGWLTFGLLPMEIEGDNSHFGTIHMVKIFITWTSAIIALILLSINMDSKTLKWITFGTAMLMIVETLYQFAEYSGIVSLIGYTVFIFWFLIFSIISISPNANNT